MIKQILHRFGYVPIKESFISSFVRYMTIHTELDDFTIYHIIRLVENKLIISEYKAISLIMSAPLNLFSSGYNVDFIVNSICDIYHIESNKKNDLWYIA